MFWRNSLKQAMATLETRNIVLGNSRRAPQARFQLPDARNFLNPYKGYYDPDWASRAYLDDD